MADLSAQLAEIIAERFPPGNVILTDPAHWLDPPTDRPIEFQLGWWAALTMIAQTGDDGLTDNEHAVVSKVGALAGDYMNLIGDTATAADDWAEILPHLHALQQAVMAQAAARAHPGRYRALGQTLDTDTE